MLIDSGRALIIYQCCVTLSFVLTSSCCVCVRTVIPTLVQRMLKKRTSVFYLTIIVIKVNWLISV